MNDQKEKRKQFPWQATFHKFFIGVPGKSILLPNNYRNAGLHDFKGNP